MTPVAIGAAKDEPPFTPVAPAREVKTGTFCPNAQKSFAQLSLSPADWSERVTPPTLITPSMSCGKESVSFGALPPAATRTSPWSSIIVRICRRAHASCSSV